MPKSIQHPGRRLFLALAALCLVCGAFPSAGAGEEIEHRGDDSSLIYDPGTLPARDSELAVAAGDPAPDFRLPAIGGGEIALSDYRGRSNVILSFVPAAWTPVCSGQWPAYRLIQQDLEDADAVLLGITVDNIPTLHAWVLDMGGLYFPVLSDFWPHGEVASRYGILRSDGTSERATFLVDKAGVLRYVDVHDINAPPDIEPLVRALEALPAE